MHIRIINNIGAEKEKLGDEETFNWPYNNHCLLWTPFFMASNEFSFLFFFCHKQQPLQPPVWLTKAICPFFFFLFIYSFFLKKGDLIITATSSAHALLLSMRMLLISHWISPGSTHKSLCKWFIPNISVLHKKIMNSNTYRYENFTDYVCAYISLRKISEIAR